MKGNTMEIEVIEGPKIKEHCDHPKDHRLYWAIGKNCPCIQSKKLGWVVHEKIGIGIVNPRGMGVINL